MTDSEREAELVDRLRQAFSRISDMLVYSPDYMHGLPKKTYKKSLLDAEKWLEERYGLEPMKAHTFAQIDQMDETLL